MTATPLDQPNVARDNSGGTLLEVRNLVKYFPVRSSG